MPLHRAPVPYRKPSIRSKEVLVSRGTQLRFLIRFPDLGLFILGNKAWTLLFHLTMYFLYGFIGFYYQFS